MSEEPSAVGIAAALGICDAYQLSNGQPAQAGEGRAGRGPALAIAQRGSAAHAAVRLPGQPKVAG
jgi:hypothetical protein